MSANAGLRTQAEIATELGMTENAVKQAFHRFRQRYRLLLREEIAHTVAQAGDVEDELRHLVSVLRGKNANCTGETRITRIITNTADQLVRVREIRFSIGENS